MPQALLSFNVMMITSYDDTDTTASKIISKTHQPDKKNNIKLCGCKHSVIVTKII
jgi:hypothetical protein